MLPEGKIRQARDTCAAVYIYTHARIPAYTGKVISFLLLFASANAAVLIQKKRGKKEGARENVALLCLLFFLMTKGIKEKKEKT